MNSFKRFLAVAAVALLPATASAQAVADSALTSANDVFYSLANGTAKEAARASWDLAFSINRTSSIRTNGGGGVVLYKALADTNGWASLDTTGKLTDANILVNSSKDWLIGSFNSTANPNDQFDNGWAVYNSTTHAVVGDSLFFVKLADASYKKIWIKSRLGSIYTFQFANLDGTGLQSVTLNTDSYSGQDFIYYSLGTATAQPATFAAPSADWDLLFTKYTDPTEPAVNGSKTYPVSGVLQQSTVTATEVATGTAWADGTALSSDVNTIGSDWKSFNNTTFQYEYRPVDFFVKAQNNDVWRVVFTRFGSSKFFFTKEKVGSVTALDADALAASFAVYPNPATSSTTVVYEAGNSPVALSLTDLSGRTVRTQQLPAAAGVSTHTLNLDGLTPGLYVLTLQGGSAAASQRLVVR